MGLKQQVEIWPQRVDWWTRISSIIKNSSKLMVVESYFGNHHPFWNSLKERVRDSEPFEFVLLTLREDSPALRNILKLTGSSQAAVLENDKKHIQDLKTLWAESPYRDKKNLEFLNWNGHGPGSVIWWTADGKDNIGLGCWLQDSANTDGTPWIVLQQGPLFEWLRRHCEQTAELARLPVAAGTQVEHTKTIQKAEIVDVDLFESDILQEARRMADYYAIYYALENSIRRLISGRLSEKYGPNWWNDRVPEQVRNEVAKKQKEERDTAMSIRSEDPLAYTNFGELIPIFSSNWADFSDTLRSEKSMYQILSQFNKIRNTVAHSCELNEDEITRFKLSVKDWFRIQL